MLHYNVFNGANICGKCFVQLLMLCYSCQVSKIDAEKIQVTALRCIVDCLHLYGIDEFAESSEILPDTILGHPPEEEEKEECVENGGAVIAALCEVSQ